MITAAACFCLLASLFFTWFCLYSSMRYFHNWVNKTEIQAVASISVQNMFCFIKNSNILRDFVLHKSYMRIPRNVFIKCFYKISDLIEFNLIWLNALPMIYMWIPPSFSRFSEEKSNHPRRRRSFWQLPRCKNTYWHYQNTGSSRYSISRRWKSRSQR